MYLDNVVIASLVTVLLVLVIFIYLGYYGYRHFRLDMEQHREDGEEPPSDASPPR